MERQYGLDDWERLQNLTKGFSYRYHLAGSVLSITFIETKQTYGKMRVNVSEQILAPANPYRTEFLSPGGFAIRTYQTDSVQMWYAFAMGPEVIMLDANSVLNFVEPLRG